jgi:hypothetical protein
MYLDSSLLLQPYSYVDCLTEYCKCSLIDLQNRFATLYQYQSLACVSLLYQLCTNSVMPSSRCHCWHVACCGGWQAKHLDRYRGLKHPRAMTLIGIVPHGTCAVGYCSDCKTARLEGKNSPQPCCRQLLRHYHQFPVRKICGTSAHNWCCMHTSSVENYSAADPPAS